jgi:hypothetical protein
MPNHKFTMLGHQARKKINTLLQQQRGEYLTQETRRLAYAEGVIAISGKDGVKWASQKYGVDLTSLSVLEPFRAMLHNYHFVADPELQRAGHDCAEARLWMTLFDLHSRSCGQAGQTPRHAHSHPRHLHVWVYEFDRKYRAKEDSPCGNCRQWVRFEFASVNGTSRAAKHDA